MIHRLLAAAFYLAGLGCLVTAACFYFWAASGPALEFAQTEVELSDGFARETRDVVFHLQNRSGRPVRVLGLTPSCGLNSCFGPDTPGDRPAELPAGASELAFPVKILQAGEFRSQLTLWVDDGGTRGIVLIVHGIARKAPAQAKEKATP